MNDVRWVQRFSNFEKAYNLLHSALAEKHLDQFSELEKEGLIQRFEFSFELAWKTMKDFLEDGGVVVTTVTPRAVIKEAVSAKLIDNGQVWVNMMLHRNLLSHNYDFSKFQEVLEALEESYLNAFTTFYRSFAAKRQEI